MPDHKNSLDHAAASDLGDNEVRADDEPDPVSGLGLTVPLNIRISPHADYTLKAEASRLYKKPGTLARELLYQALGLIKPAAPKTGKPKRRK